MIGFTIVIMFFMALSLLALFIWGVVYLLSQDSNTLQGRRKEWVGAVLLVVVLIMVVIYLWSW
jgi:uncharacterized membrane protein